MKQSKVKAVTLGKEWTSKHGGTFYNHTYQLEDGTTLQASHKTELPFNVGDEVEYDITSTDEQYGNKGKVKKPDTGGGFSRGGGYKPDTVGVTVGACLNLAVGMYNAGKFDDLAKIESTADWLIEMSFRLKGKHQDKG